MDRIILIFAATAVLTACSGEAMNPSDFQFTEISHGVEYTFGDGTVTDGRYYSRDYGDTWSDYGVQLYHMTSVDDTTAIGFTINFPSSGTDEVYQIKSDGTIIHIYTIAGISSAPQPRSSGIHVAGLKFYFAALKYDSGTVGCLALYDFETGSVTLISSELSFYFKIICLNGNSLIYVKMKATNSANDVIYKYNISSGIIESSVTLSDNSPLVYSGYIDFSGTVYLIIITQYHIFYSKDGITFTTSHFTGLNGSDSSSYFTGAVYIKNRLFNSLFLSYYSNNIPYIHRMRFENGQTIESYNNKDPEIVGHDKDKILLPVDTGTEQLLIGCGTLSGSDTTNVLYSGEGSLEFDNNISLALKPIKVINADGSMITDTTPPYKIVNCTVQDSGIYMQTKNGAKQLKRFNVSNARCFDGQRFLHAYTTENASKEIILFANKIPPTDGSHGYYNIYGEEMFLY